MTDILEIKVCGMTQIAQVRELAELGINYAGFIFYEKSPRYVVGRFKPEELRQVSAAINKVGVFVNEDYDTILKIVDEYGLNAVQLHGDETPDLCARLSSHIKTIKAFRLAGDEDFTLLLNGYADTVDFFLFDTKAKEYGGTGKKFNWKVLDQSVIEKPFFLSGGIGADDAHLTADFIRKKSETKIIPDLNSRFENAPGIKNMEAVKKFVNEIRKT